MIWSFFQIWNKSLELGREERPIKARNNMWASELGGSYIDRYLKMTGVKPTNPPDTRSIRKFEAGNFMEWVVGRVLKRAGILIQNQEWLSFQYPGLVEVTGKNDYFAGGNPDWVAGLKEVEDLELPEFFNRATLSIIEYFSANFPNGLDKIVLEVKSCSLMMFEKYERVGAAKNHKLQCYHYLKAKNIEEGHIVYICKDDLRMLEIPVYLNDPEVEQEYKQDIALMTYHLSSGVCPEKEPEIILDVEMGKFTKNWKVEYSNYITLLYGYENQHSFFNTHKGRVAKWNRVLKRCIDGSNMTKLNLEVIEDIKAWFPDFENIVVDLKARGVKLEEEVEEE